MEKQSTWRRWIWPMLCIVLAAGLIGCIFWATSAKAERDQRTIQLQNVYERSLDEISGNLSNIATTLAKMRVSTSPSQQALLLGSVWRMAGEAQDAVSALPITSDVSGPMLQFVNELGDYCYMLSKSVERGTSITQEQYDTLYQLEQRSQELFTQVDARRAEGIAWNLDGQQAYPADDAQQSQIAKSLEQYPRLIYDGPFSERAETIEPRGANGAEVSYEQAVAVAQQYFAGTYTDTGEVGGQVPVYSMQCKQEDGKEYAVTITKKSGWMHAVVPLSEPSTDERANAGMVPEMEQIAKDFLESHGYPEMTSAYAQYYNGVMVINMAPLKEAVILYPDLVKVWVDIGTKQVIGMDAHNYVVNHTNRTLPDSTYSFDLAYERVSQRMEITDYHIVLIPTEDLKEQLCYEFVGTNREQTFVVQINAVTGIEEDILQIIDAENGTFTY